MLGAERVCHLLNSSSVGDLDRTVLVFMANLDVLSWLYGSIVLDLCCEGSLDAEGTPIRLVVVLGVLDRLTDGAWVLIHIGCPVCSASATGAAEQNRLSSMSIHDDQCRAAFVEWMALPEPERVPNTLAEFASVTGVPVRTLSSWKKQSWFRDDLATLYAQVNVSPDRLQAVLDAAHATAVAGNTKAMELYLRYVEAIAPKKIIIESKQVDDMSDYELSAALKAAAAEMDRREAKA